MNVPDADPQSIETLLAIMKQLRDPETGCPWDVKQDFQSIAPYTLEEAYEVVDAIEEGDEKGDPDGDKGKEEACDHPLIAGLLCPG